jgi:hypothetical protein
MQDEFSLLKRRQLVKVAQELKKNPDSLADLFCSCRETPASTA